MPPHRESGVVHIAVARSTACGSVPPPEPARGSLDGMSGQRVAGAVDTIGVPDRPDPDGVDLTRRGRARVAAAATAALAAALVAVPVALAAPTPPDVLAGPAGLAAVGPTAAGGAGPSAAAPTAAPPLAAEPPAAGPPAAVAGGAAPTAARPTAAGPMAPPPPVPAAPTASGTPATPAGPPPPTPSAPAGAGVPAPGAGYAWPLLPAPVVRTPFRAPAHAYGPGHRGVDLVGVPGQAVLAARGGTVVFAGPVAGRPVVSVQHDDGLRTTYEPVLPAVTAGLVVAPGAVLGTLEPGHPGCPDAACLHWGVRRDRTDHLDPLVLLRPAQVRLLPVPDPWPA